MKYCWTTLSVRDLEESEKFYNEIVGLDVKRKFNAGPDTEIIFLSAGETEIELIYNKGNSSPNHGKDISLGFEVKSIDAMMSLVKSKGVPVHSGPFQPNPHIRFFYVLDPNGLKIQFVENL